MAKHLMTYAVTFTANANNFVQGLSKAQRALMQLRVQVLAISAGAASAMSVAAALIRDEVASVSIAYDKALTESLAVMEHVTPQIRKQVMDVTRTLATQTTTSAQKAAEGFKHLALSGLDVNAAMAALPIVNQFAIAGIMDMQQATDLLIDSQAALGLTLRENADANAAEMERLADVFAKAATISNASIEQFSVALTSKAGAAMKLFNISTEQGIAVLSAYAEQGIKAQLAGNAYDRALRLLSKAAISNARQQALLGFSVFDAQGKMRNMADIIQNLEDILRGLTDEQKAATLTMLGFEAKSQQVITPLIGMSKAIRDYESALNNASGYTKDVAEKNMDSMAGQVEILKNKFKEFALQIADSFLPGIRQTNEILQNLMDVLNSLHPWVSGFAGIIVSLVITVPTVTAVITLLTISQNLLAYALVQTNLDLMQQLTLLGMYRRLLTIGLPAMVATVAAGFAAKAISDKLAGVAEVEEATKKLENRLEAGSKKQQLQINDEIREIDKLSSAKEKMVEVERQIQEAQKKAADARKSSERLGKFAQGMEQNNKIFGVSGTNISWWTMSAGERKQYEATLALQEAELRNMDQFSEKALTLAAKRNKLREILEAGEKANAIENMRANVPHSGYADKGFEMAETMKNYIGDLKRIPTIWEMADKAQDKMHKAMLKMKYLMQKEFDRAKKQQLQENVDVEKTKLETLKKDLEETKAAEKEKLREHKSALKEHEKMIKAIKDYERDDDKLAIASRGQVFDSIMKRLTVMPSAPVEPVFAGPGSSDAIKDEIAATEAAIQTAQNTKEQYIEQVKQREAMEKVFSLMSGILTGLGVMQAARVTP